MCIRDRAEVVPLVEVEGSEALIGLDGHRHENAHAVDLSRFELPHDAIEESLGLLFRRHLADVERARHRAIRAGQGRISRWGVVGVRLGAEALADDEGDHGEEGDGGHGPGQHASEAARRSGLRAGGGATAVAEARAGCERSGARGAGRTGERGSAARAEATGRQRAAGWARLRRRVGRRRSGWVGGPGHEGKVIVGWADSRQTIFSLVTQSRALLPDLKGATTKDVLDLARTLNVRFLRLQFTDILGVNKNVEIPASQFEKALAGDIMFDGSSIEGFVRIEESDMLLAPDLSTFRVFPWGDPQNRVGRLICDINTPDGAPFAGDPRGALKRAVAKAADAGFSMNAGMEAEFFMFRPRSDGGA